MTTSIDTVLTPREIAHLQRRGIKPERFYPSTGELLVWINDEPYGLTLHRVKQMARPSLIDRVRDWIGGIAA